MTMAMAMTMMMTKGYVLQGFSQRDIQGDPLFEDSQLNLPKKYCNLLKTYWQIYSHHLYSFMCLIFTFSG